MARFIGKTKEGQEIFAYDMSGVEVKSVGENEIEMIGSTENVDRDNEVLKLDGWDLKNYKKNPVVLPAHMYWEPAIGRAKVRIDDKNLVFRIEFPPAGINPIADIYKGLYKGGFMKASSVGFIGQDWKWGEKEEEPRRTFLKQELLEISLVSVPANPNALLTEKGIEQAVKAGKLRSDDIKVLEGLIKRCFDLDPERRKVFILPTMEVKTDEPKETEKLIQCEKCGKDFPEPQGKCACVEKSQGDPSPEEHQKHVAEIKKIAEEAFRDFLKDHEPKFVEKVVGITLKEIEKILAVKGHYINGLLKDQVPPSTTESLKQAEKVGNTLKESFKLSGSPSAKT